MMSIRDHQEAVTAVLLVFAESPIRARTELNRGFLTSLDCVPRRKAGITSELAAMEEKCAGLGTCEDGEAAQRTVAEQIEALISEATKEEDLGRIYWGWWVWR
jgi:hypothetical protein